MHFLDLVLEEGDADACERVMALCVRLRDLLATHETAKRIRQFDPTTINELNETMGVAFGFCLATVQHVMDTRAKLN